MHNAFSGCGRVIRLYTFEKDNMPQGFVEFSSKAAADTCQRTLNAQSLYDGGVGLLTVRDTPRARVNVRTCDRHMWDASSGVEPGERGSIPGIDDSRGAGGDARPAGGAPALSRRERERGGRGAKRGICGAPPEGARYEPYRGGAGASGGAGGVTADGPCTSPVVMMNGLPVIENTVGKRVMTPQALMKLVGCYGDVQMVKFVSPNGKNGQATQAFVELRSTAEAETVRRYLDGLPIFGSLTRVRSATNGFVSLGSGGDTDLQADFRESKLHRFGNPNEFTHIASPKPTLLVWNYPSAFDERELLRIVTCYGTVEAMQPLRLRGNDRFVAIQMENTDQAAVCLIHLQGLEVGTGAGGAPATIRVCFALDNIHCPPEEPSQTSYKVMVKGLKQGFTDNQLAEICRPFGRPLRHAMWRDKKTKKTLGFGLVDFSVCVTDAERWTGGGTKKGGKEKRGGKKTPPVPHATATHPYTDEGRGASVHCRAGQDDSP